MEPPPLTLSVLRLTPSTLTSPPSSSAYLEDVPATPLPLPSLPSSFSLSPTHNYPAPFGTMTLGTSLGVKLQLIANPPSSPRPGSSAGDIADADDGMGMAPGVRGVKMMLEVQGPGGRWRLGEVVHGEEAVPEGDEALAVEGKEEEKETGEGKIEAEGAGDSAETAVPDENTKMPNLSPGEFVEMDVQAEMKELGLQVLICSVAWETPNGRRTFQRFFKFNVVAPLSIKTKIHPSQTPMTQLDPTRRGDVYLEVLMQNTSAESILFDKVNLEPVYGMTATSITPSSAGTLDSEVQDDVLGSLHPGDTRQYLFLLHPQPPPPTKARQSVFPPVFAPGTVLPLGRLDMAWLAGAHRERGRLQTSTLNRRVAAAPIAPTRTVTAAPPTPGQGVGTPSRLRQNAEQEDGEEADGWEYDLSVLELERSGVEIDKEFTAKLRVGLRSMRTYSADGIEGVDQQPPPALRLAVQYLTAPPYDPNLPLRPTSPPDTVTAGPSRPMTPISSQLRHATQTHLNSNGHLPAIIDPTPSPSSTSFPPAPTLQRPAPPPKSEQERKEGEVFPLGPSLVLLPAIPFQLAQEQYSTTYADSSEPPERWEAVHELEMRFLAVQEGMARLGGVRVLVIEDEVGMEGSVGAEWETLGDIWITS
ncbi:uncharacterized protein MKK02DRAFT_39946 [Dioszegia hungarica]|uniref:DUF974-domain-containing protein n=1 Tax=Dioszegia hungarica TaxID=4972 RepID=A0AA38HFY6_9TREE|nr:uncharacterized protein MKK02DRAFT_39946 [Dioszegia hungarica]KAI9639622.1 hypothetical protein MKK02DRAFT_39946 [Dioszegia hungarica]